MSGTGENGLPCEAGEVATRAVAAAVWAPSVHNTQPWRFAAGGAEITLHADAGRQLAVADPAGREMMMSCGAALLTAGLAVRSLGYLPEMRVLPDHSDPLLIARLRWRRRAAPADWEERLSRQITRRRTHRGGFEPAPLPPGLIAALRQDAARHGAALRVAVSSQSRAVLAAITQLGERVQHQDSAYSRELAAWTPPPGSTRLDGVPPTAYPAHAELTDPYFPGRDFAHGHGWGLPHPSRIAEARLAGVVCVLTTPTDGPAAWVSAGQALQHILLTATAYGVAAALHSQPVEVGWLRDTIRGQLSDGGYPQLILRLGTALQDEVSTRRPAGAVLTAPS